MEYDAGRGGWGAGRLREEEERQKREAEEKKRREGQEELYRQAEQEGQGAGQTGATVPGGADAEYFESENRAGGADVSIGGIGKRGRRDDDDDEEDDDDRRGAGDDDDLYGDAKRRREGSPTEQ